MGMPFSLIPSFITSSYVLYTHGWRTDQVTAHMNNPIVAHTQLAPSQLFNCTINTTYLCALRL